MAKADRAREGETVIKDHVTVSSWLWVGFGLVVLAAAPWILMAAGTGEIMVRSNPYTLEYDHETWAFVQPLEIIVVLLGYPIVVALLLLRRTATVRVAPDRITLLGKGNAWAAWGDLDRIVLWRMRVRRLGLIPGWEPMVGLVEDTERNRNFREAARTKQWGPDDLRANGVPDWLPGGIQKRSVRLSHRSGSDLAAAVAKAAPNVPVVDETRPGRPRTIAPGKAR